jgi:ferrous iron transport protein A
MVFNFDRQRNAPSERMSTALADLEPGEAAEITAVTVPGPLGRRLEDMGFLPGTRVTLVRRAPLGDPSVYELRGTQLCLRRREASGIEVCRLESRSAGPAPAAAASA